jgi:hypothetical protein
MVCPPATSETGASRPRSISNKWAFVSNYYALQITFRLSPVQIVNFLCPIDEISVIRASIEHKNYCGTLLLYVISVHYSRDELFFEAL